LLACFFSCLFNTLSANPNFILAIILQC
jgi:hypothetical protein